MTKEMTTFTIEAGGLMISTIRNFLNEIKYVYKRDITWREGEGWLTRPFWITTDTFTAGVIKAELDRIERERVEEAAEEERKEKEKPWWKFW